ncbi:hypothetical protein [Tessaracoccus defluvii]|uniref:Uncharacterized protein n=1 Tax=Tessaracoccus defluvii TaxID=1285901 RepID=A0A7H0H4C4_9ACTN|nr:hypothetical protein [Tessaracoccus defluvii]QNP55390.1 hypothetical protein H9L22_14430 [Tessaracoccus defluvii]
MSTTHLVRARTGPPTVIVLPEPARLSWRDRAALGVSIWLIEHAVTPGQSHAEQSLERHTADQVAQRELRSLGWLPPR